MKTNKPYPETKNLNNNIKHILTECKTPLPELSAELKIPLERLHDMQQGNPQEEMDVGEFFRLFRYFSIDPDDLFKDTPPDINRSCEHKKGPR